MQTDGVGIDSGKIERIKQSSHIDDTEYFKKIERLKEEYEKTVKENNEMFNKNIK